MQLSIHLSDDRRKPLFMEATSLEELIRFVIAGESRRTVPETRRQLPEPRRRKAVSVIRSRHCRLSLLCTRGILLRLDACLFGLLRLITAAHRTELANASDRALPKFMVSTSVRLERSSACVGPLGIQDVDCIR